MKTIIACMLIWSMRALAAEDAPLWMQMQKAVLVSKDVAEVKRVLDAGFDPNASIGCGDWPALLGAVSIRNVEMAKLLLERGAKVPDVAMLWASQTFDRDLALVSLLRGHGGNVNASEEFSSCLHAATWHGNVPLVRLLSASPGIRLNIVRHDGDCDGTPLAWALRLGHTEVADILVAAGADATVKGKHGTTAASVIAERIQAYERLRTRLVAK